MGKSKPDESDFKSLRDSNTYLFMSDFTSESDIDIIVDFKQPVGVKFIDLAEFLESKIASKIDLVSKNGIKAEYYMLIEQEIMYV